MASDRETEHTLRELAATLIGGEISFSTHGLMEMQAAGKIPPAEAEARYCVG